MIREYTGVLAAMRSQGFEPDRTRSGMVTPSRMPMAATTPPGLAASGGNQLAATLGAHALQAKVEPKPEEDIDAISLTSKDLFGDFSPIPASDSEPGETAAPAMSKEVIQVEELSETEEEASQISTSDSGDGPFSRQVTEADLPGFGSKFFVNIKTQMIHCCRDSCTFRCGRKLTEAYSPVHELFGMRCTQCFDN